MTSPKWLKNTLRTLKSVKQTEEIKQVREYLEFVDREKGAKGWSWYLYMTNKENMAREVLAPLEKLVWSDQDEEIVDKKIIPEFRKKISGRTLEEQLDKMEEYGTKKKISRLWKIATKIAVDLAARYGHKNTAHLAKPKNAKK